MSKDAEAIKVGDLVKLKCGGRIYVVARMWAHEVEIVDQNSIDERGPNSLIRIPVAAFVKHRHSKDMA